jgi:hypothetical protein
MGTLFWMAHRRDWLMAQYTRLAQRWKILQRFGHTRVDAFISGLAVLKDTRLFFQAIFWLTINWSIGILQYYLMMKAFIPQATPLWAAFTLGVMAIGVAAPSSPGAMGVFELTIVAALSFFGIDAAVSGAYALTMHLAHYLTTGVLGSIGLVKDGLTLSGVYQKASSVPLELSES